MKKIQISLMIFLSICLTYGQEKAQIKILENSKKELEDKITEIEDSIEKIEFRIIEIKSI